jgi:hypothetical protein
VSDEELEEIICQFLPPGGSMGPRYVLQLLFGKKITKLLKTQQPLKLEKNSKDLESLEF